MDQDADPNKEVEVEVDPNKEVDDEEEDDVVAHDEEVKGLVAYHDAHDHLLANAHKRKKLDDDPDYDLEGECCIPTFILSFNLTIL